MVLARELALAIEDAIDRLLLPSLEAEYRRTLKQRADEEAIRVFARNLTALLLSPPLGGKPVVAIDPGLRERLTPAYRIGCKRILLSSDWYPALSQPNVEVVTAPIARAVPEGLEFADGTHRARPQEVLVSGDDGRADDGGATALRNPHTARPAASGFHLGGRCVVGLSARIGRSSGVGAGVIRDHAGRR